MSKLVPSVNLILWDDINKKYVVGSFITISDSIVWNRPIIDEHRNKYGDVATSFEVLDPKSTDRFYIDDWLIESDEYGNVTLNKKVEINDLFTIDDTNTKITASIPLPTDMLLASGFENVQCTNATTDEVLQRCVINVNLAKNDEYYTNLNINMLLTSVFDAKVEDDVRYVNIYENTLLQSPSDYVDQYLYVTIRGNIKK